MIKPFKSRYKLYVFSAEPLMVSAADMDEYVCFRRMMDYAGRLQELTGAILTDIVQTSQETAIPVRNTPWCLSVGKGVPGLGSRGG